MTNVLARKLQQVAPLSADDMTALTDLVRHVSHAASRQDITSLGCQSGYNFLILQGWSARYKVLENGRKQITALLLPGDLCYAYDAPSHCVDHPIGTLTPVAFARIPLETVRDVTRQRPALEEALRWASLVTHSIQSELMVSLGQRNAMERLGHLFCELYMRLRNVGLTDGNSYDLVITQADLGDLLGLSNVHINRTLRDLRAVGLITLKGRRLTLHDFDALAEASLFDPSYLQPYRGVVGSF
jgi:CRP-like cAMP-binding protein